ncbi:MAG: hypothetical protein IK107_05950 [Oscillospiraceae bacterium]|nr:hypothetical protein [Oscillospiraceae bacterium]
MAQKKQSARSRILAAGGDLRTVKAAARLAECEEVLLAGFDRLETLPAGVRGVADVRTLPAHSADVLLLPVQAAEDAYDAPFSRMPLRFSELLPAVRRGGLVLGGRMSGSVCRQIAEAGCSVEDYAARESFAERNAVPTAEAAVGIAMRELPVTVSGLSCLILGAGRISRALQPRLRAWGASVTVAARRCSDLARRGGGEGKPGLCLCAECCCRENDGSPAGREEPFQLCGHLRQKGLKITHDAGILRQRTAREKLLHLCAERFCGAVPEPLVQCVGGTGRQIHRERLRPAERCTEPLPQHQLGEVVGHRVGRCQVAGRIGGEHFMNFAGGEGAEQFSLVQQRRVVKMCAQHAADRNRLTAEQGIFPVQRDGIRLKARIVLRAELCKRLEQPAEKQCLKGLRELIGAAEGCFCLFVCREDLLLAVFQQDGDVRIAECAECCTVGVQRQQSGVELIKHGAVEGLCLCACDGAAPALCEGGCVGGSGLVQREPHGFEPLCGDGSLCGCTVQQPDRVIACGNRLGGRRRGHHPVHGASSSLPAAASSSAQRSAMSAHSASFAALGIRKSGRRLSAAVSSSAKVPLVRIALSSR